MSPSTNKLVSKLATFDKTEKVWEIHIPLPRTIEAQCDGASFDEAIEFDEWAGAHGIDYNNVTIDTDRICVNGIELMKG